MRAAADMVCNLILVLAQIKVHALMLLFRIICRNNMKPIEGLKLLRCTFVTYQSHRVLVSQTSLAPLMTSINSNLRSKDVIVEWNRSFIANC